MKIAIDTADLGCERIDGTRVYIQNVLKYLGKLASEDEFFLFHKTEYNKLLRPAEFDNYHDKSLGKGFWWTQIKFARAVRKLKPGVCWMPIQQIPGLNFQFSIFNFQSIFNSLIFKFKLVFNGRKKDKRVREVSIGGGIKYVVTIHDLAFKFFGSHFPLVDRLKINFYTDVAVRRADKIIAISEATKRDLIRLYPGIDENKIVVVHHGFDRENFEQKFSEEEKVQFLKKWKIIESKVNPTSLKLRGTRSRKSVESIRSLKSVKSLRSDVNVFNDKGSYLKTPQNFRSSNFDPLYTGGRYLLYVGAIQPRKDLVTLIRAFNKIKFQDTNHKTQTNSKIQDTRYKQIPRYKSQDTNKSQDTIQEANGELQIINDSGEITNDKSQMTNANVQADNKLQKAIDASGLKLVLVGERAWKSESTLREIERSEFKNDIIVTGKVDFKELAMFFRWAKVFVFPSLYEGFGIPILEAMASKTPVVVADNSSLLEVGGEAVLKFKTGDSDNLEEQLRKLLGDKNLQDKMIRRGLEQIKKFSWEKCARETLRVLKEV